MRDLELIIFMTLTILLVSHFEELELRTWDSTGLDSCSLLPEFVCKIQSCKELRITSTKFQRGLSTICTK